MPVNNSLSCCCQFVQSTLGLSIEIVLLTAIVILFGENDLRCFSSPPCPSIPTSFFPHALPEKSVWERGGIAWRAIRSLHLSFGRSPTQTRGTSVTFDVHSVMSSGV